jgi:hypothetical protein
MTTAGQVRRGHAVAALILTIAAAGTEEPDGYARLRVRSAELGGDPLGGIGCPGVDGGVGETRPAPPPEVAHEDEPGQPGTPADRPAP